MPETEKDSEQQPLSTEKPTSQDEDDRHGNQLAIGFAIFIPIGIALGLTVFDNVGIGVAAGLGMGSIYSIFMGRSVD